jgi:23S rRNA pseudouridine955/2504/2580 synthase
LEKYYLGIIRGYLETDCEWHDMAESGKEMITYAVPLAHSVKNGEQFTLARYRIVTGRKHQIRIQTSGHGFPLAGDETYKGGKPVSGNSYFLHAWQMYFPEDRPEGIPEKLIAPLGGDFKQCILDIFGKLDWSDYEKLQ